MALSEEEVREFRRRIDAALARGDLGDWATKFLRDIRWRMDQHGSNTRLSVKQWNKLQELTGSIRVPNPTIRHSTSAVRRSTKGSSLRPNIQMPHIAIFVALLVAAGALAYPLFAGGSLFFGNSWIPFTVTDGDTIRFWGRPTGTRLVGFNTPETFTPQCERERELGTRATDRLKELIATTSIEISEVPCACEPGTEGTSACNFGRTCAIMRANGRNVGDILISEGLAARFVCGRTSCPRLPRPWCP
jgi:micrococcal nuclease